MTNTKIFLGGVPTEPDVTALNEAFPVSELLPGKFIEDSQISAVINVSPRSSRFKTVLDRWRKVAEREHGMAGRGAAWHGKARHGGAGNRPYFNLAAI